MTIETVLFLNELLDSFGIQANNPNFEELAERVVVARKELRQAIKDSSITPKK